MALQWYFFIQGYRFFSDFFNETLYPQKKTFTTILHHFLFSCTGRPWTAGNVWQRWSSRSARLPWRERSTWRHGKRQTSVAVIITVEQQLLPCVHGYNGSKQSLECLTWMVCNTVGFRIDHTANIYHRDYFLQPNSIFAIWGYCTVKAKVFTESLLLWIVTSEDSVDHKNQNKFYFNKMINPVVVLINLCNM